MVRYFLIDSTQNLPDPTKTTLTISQSGFYMGLAFSIFEFCMTLFSIALAIPWLLSANPISPAVRLVRDQTYFNIMVGKNSTAAILRERNSISTRIDVWSKMDVIIRVGESKKTIHDTDEGKLVIDKSKLVSPLSFTKRY